MTRTLAPTLGLAALAALTSFVAPHAARAQTSYTVIDLHPAGYTASEALAASGTAQVGDGADTAAKNNSHALLWHGKATGVVDLNPPGYRDTVAQGVSGSTQVGYGEGRATHYLPHAFLWHGGFFC